jgi:hypothetical protein
MMASTWREFIKAALFRPKSSEFRKVGLYIGFPGAVLVHTHSGLFKGSDDANAFLHILYGITAPWAGWWGIPSVAFAHHVVIPTLFGLDDKSDEQ